MPVVEVEVEGWGGRGKVKTEFVEPRRRYDDYAVGTLLDVGAGETVGEKGGC